jgi:GWxTD domain-containing protein
MQRLYRSMGLIAGSGAIPFVSSVSFLRAPSTDSTLTVVALSLPARALGFTRQGERYAAGYVARLEVRQGTTIIKQIEATQQVLVPTFRETARTDESIIWQQFLKLAPGRYTLTLGIKDESSIRTASEEVQLEVPRLTSEMFGSPLPVYEAIPRSSADSLPRILARPRATVVFGQDSVLPLYLDAVGAEAPAGAHIRIVGDGDVVLWDRDIEMPLRGTGRSTTVGVPVARMGIGINTLLVSAPGRPDTARARVLVSLGEDLPIASFEEMFAYLRYFTTADRLRALRDATTTQRPEAWATFLKATDPIPGTAEHEGLRDYFGRIRVANIRFRDDGPVGWQSDRGIAFVALGDPDNIIDTGMTNPNARVRQQVWEYRELRVQIVFNDQTGFGRWRLTSQGRADLDNAIRRRLTVQQ